MYLGPRRAPVVAVPGCYRSSARRERRRRAAGGAGHQAGAGTGLTPSHSAYSIAWIIESKTSCLSLPFVSLPQQSRHFRFWTLLMQETQWLWICHSPFKELMRFLELRHARSLFVLSDERVSISIYLWLPSVPSVGKITRLAFENVYAVYA